MRKAGARPAFLDVRYRYLQYRLTDGPPQPKR